MTVNFDARADAIAIRSGPTEPDADCRLSPRTVVLERAYLRSAAAPEDDIGTAISVKIGHRKRTRIISEIEAADP